MHIQLFHSGNSNLNMHFLLSARHFSRFRRALSIKMLNNDPLLNLGPKTLISISNRLNFSGYRSPMTSIPPAPHLLDVTTSSFETEVIEQSVLRPVLVDFWAAWCGPCQILMPLLARLAEEYGGAFRLAKLNTDTEHAIASRYRVRSLPTVKVFRNRAVVDEFMGVQPERSIRAFIDRHIPRASDQAIDEALATNARGENDKAVEQLRAAMAEDPANDRVKQHLASLLFEQNQVDEGEAVLNKLSREARSRPEIQTLFARLEFLRLAHNAPPTAELKGRIERDPSDMEARLHLGARYILAEQYEAGLDQLLEITRRDRAFGNDAGRRTILSVFNLLGDKGEIVKRYRALLSTALN